MKFVILDPGHFHAALVLKNMYPEVSHRVSVYAPLSTDVLDFLNRITLFNTRADQPAAWELDMHTSSDYFERMAAAKDGDVVVLAGRNRPKIDRIIGSLDAGFHVLADKPWIISSKNLPKLSHALDLAESKGLIAYDIMTERFEITSILQRELVRDRKIFGDPVSVKARSIHHLMKMVAGTPIRRPAWLFDIDEYGEALADVGTHVVDLVQWTLFSDRELDWRKDVEILSGKRWPTVIDPAQFLQVTGVAGDATLDYYCNNSVQYKICGVPVELDIRWYWETKTGAADVGDLYEAAFEGTRAQVEIRQKHEPEVFVTPSASGVLDAVRERVAAIQQVWPGVAMEERNGEAAITIPQQYRVGHESHFAQVASRFFDYVKEPKALPAWEKSNMLVKYFISTRGVEVAH